MTPSVTQPVVGRLAPSPTGRLHVGHARSFLLAWWHARSRGGRVVLRVEDLDATRVKAGMVAECRRDLEWLGLDWDGEPVLQSAELEPMRAAVAALIESERAYACTCSRRDIAGAVRAPHAGERELRYPGTCRGRWASVGEGERSSGSAAGVRLRVPDGEVELIDAFVGSFRADVQAEVGDFLLARRDGAFAYQLAVVVDDARQGVTEVLRGDDLLPSSTRQWHVQEALGLPHPTWIHVPLVVDERGRRLAKRDGDTTLSALRADGVDPRALVAWTARSAGLDVRERVAALDVVGMFDLAGVPRTPVIFGPRERADLGRG